MKILNQLFLDRNITKKTTQETYIIPTKQYEKVHKKTIEELIQEADKEEEEMIRLKNRKIKTRLLKFRQYMIQQGLSKNTIRIRMTRITTIYRHFEIELPKLPPFQLKEKKFERYGDIPSKNNIKDVLNNTTNKKYKAIILFMSSSGTALNETIHLKVKDFIKATKEYHSNINLKTILTELKPQKDIIPLFEMVRLKTNYPYYTCCSPEATTAIIEFLETRKNLKIEDDLFKYGRVSVLNMFQRLNDKMGYGKVNGRIFFRSHALRKFNSTAIEDIGFANTIQGRQADSITEAYFKHNPKRIKEKYLEHLPKLTINKTIVNSVDSEAKKELENQIKILERKLEEKEDEIFEKVMDKFKNLPP